MYFYTIYKRLYKHDHQLLKVLYKPLFWLFNTTSSFWILRFNCVCFCLSGETPHSCFGFIVFLASWFLLHGLCVCVCVNFMEVILCKMLPQKSFFLEKITSINEIIFSFFYKDVRFSVFLLLSFVSKEVCRLSGKSKKVFHRGQCWAQSYLSFSLMQRIISSSHWRVGVNPGQSQILKWFLYLNFIKN